MKNTDIILLEEAYDSVTRWSSTPDTYKAYAEILRSPIPENISFNRPPDIWMQQINEHYRQIRSKYENIPKWDPVPYYIKQGIMWNRSTGGKYKDWNTLHIRVADLKDFEPENRKPGKEYNNALLNISQQIKDKITQTKEKLSVNDDGYGFIDVYKFGRMIYADSNYPTQIKYGHSSRLDNTMIRSVK